MIFRIKTSSGLPRKPCTQAVGEPNKWYVDIKGPEDLLDIMSQTGCALVVLDCHDTSEHDFNRKNHKCEVTLEVYDDYRE